MKATKKSVSSRPAKPPAKKRNITTTRGDEFPRPLPGSRIAPWAAARAATSADLKEILPLPGRIWREALKAEKDQRKKQLTIRLDADVFAWLKSLGPGYQTKLNAMLRSAMKSVS